MVRVTYHIAAHVAGEIGEVIATPAPPAPALDHVLQTMRNMAFTIETIAHLQGQERLLPLADEARKVIAQLEPRELVS